VNALTGHRPTKNLADALIRPRPEGKDSSRDWDNTMWGAAKDTNTRSVFSSVTADFNVQGGDRYAVAEKAPSGTIRALMLRRCHASQ